MKAPPPTAKFCRPLLASWWMATMAFAATPSAAPAPPSPAPTASADEDLYQAGKALFDLYAPPEIKAQHEFVSREQWNGLLSGIQTALATGSLTDLAGYDQQVRDTLDALRAIPGTEDLADWLALQLDQIEAAKEATQPPAPPPKPMPGEKPPPAIAAPAVPFYDLWLRRLHGRPAPARAAELMPGLKAAFRAEGLPAPLAWLAEVESGLNPKALSPAGARGLYQFMPATARDLGLSTLFPDERTDPSKSAHASAQMLRRLHAKFGSWPLALAAYNAGEGRVSRLLTAKHGKTYADIATDLPTETRLYVPKVLATLTLREGIPPEGLPAPARIAAPTK
ncbi:MAG: lytic transglycosylase domain-containing protein [Verrucomicrobiota bacterium]